MLKIRPCFRGLRECKKAEVTKESSGREASGKQIKLRAAIK